MVAEEIVQKQQPDGSWEFFAGLRRPPINESQTTDVAWIILSLGSLTDENSPASQQEALAKSRGWLAAADTSQLHQDLVLKLLLGIRSGAPREALQPSMDALLALQRDDGGWSQTIPEPVSDAFATGQSLYVLSLLGREAQQPEISRAMDFLVTSQAAEGHWPMASRSTPDGSPGSATLLTPIECAASSWAVLSLSRLPPRAK